jgi:Multimeric flavodoxin WrbA
MKTVILNGSPRKNGDTAALITAFRECIGGEIYQANSYTCGISPCIDCRYCWTHTVCAIKDGMSELIEQINQADIIVIASPVNFSELSGSLLSLASRLQLIWAAKWFQHIELLDDKLRHGIILLAGGGDGSPDRAVVTAKILLRQMKAEFAGAVISANTNTLAAADDPDALSEIHKLAEKLINGDK